MNYYQLDTPGMAIKRMMNMDLYPHVVVYPSYEHSGAITRAFIETAPVSMTIYPDAFDPAYMSLFTLPVLNNPAEHVILSYIASRRSV